MKRVAVLGAPGSGKSTVARVVGETLGVPVFHLDLLYWNAGWVPTPADEFVLKVSDALTGDTWACDGNYGSTLDLRLRRADTAMLLDIPIPVSVGDRSCDVGGPVRTCRRGASSGGSISMRCGSCGGGGRAGRARCGRRSCARSRRTPISM